MVAEINPELVKLARIALGTATDADLAKEAFIPAPGAAQATPPPEAAPPSMPPGGGAMPPDAGGDGIDPSMLQQAMAASGVVGTSDSPIQLTTQQLIEIIKAVTGKDGKADAAAASEAKRENAKLKAMMGIPDLSAADSVDGNGGGGGQMMGASGIGGLPPMGAMGGGQAKAGNYMSDDQLQVLVDRMKRL